MSPRSQSARSVEVGSINRHGITAWEVRFKQGARIVARQKRGGLGKIADSVADWVFNAALPAGVMMDAYPTNKGKEEGGENGETESGPTPADSSNVVPRRDA